MVVECLYGVSYTYLFYFFKDLVLLMCVELELEMLY